MMAAQIADYLNDYRGVYAQSSLEGLKRRYAKMARDFAKLRAAGSIEGVDFSNLTIDDIKAYGVSLRNRGLKQSAICHDLSALGALCRYCGCNSYDIAKMKFPLLFYSPRMQRLPPLSPAEVMRLMAAIERINGPYRLLRSAAQVAIALGGGLRPIEIQHLTTDGLNLKEGLVSVSTVKGGTTYGQARTAPLRPIAIPIMRRYMAAREIAPPTVAASHYVFCNASDGLPLAANTLRRNKADIEAAAGVKFDYRKLRRTYAQMAIDEGAKIESVSLVLGHSSTKTTEGAYGRLRPDAAINDLKSRW